MVVKVYAGDNYVVQKNALQFHFLSTFKKVLSLHTKLSH